MTTVHIRDPQGAPLCGQSQGYRRRPLEEWRKLPGHQQCKRCAKVAPPEPEAPLTRVYLAGQPVPLTVRVKR